MAGGVNDLISDIVSFFSGKIDSAERSDSVIKIVYDDGSVKYYNEADNTQINLPSEDNRLSNQASGVTVKGGTGNDTVFTNENTEKNSIDGGSGNDFIVAYDNDSTICGGDDDDRIAIFGTQNKIFGDAGKDIILLENGADSNTVNGGLGDDIIVLESVENSVIEYSAGDGNDVIIGYAESDVIHITGDYSTSISGQDVIISVGDGSIILSGASGKEININGTKELIGEESDTPLIVTIPSVWDEGVNIIRGTSGDDTVVNSSYGKNVMIHAGTGNDEINNFASNVTINGNEGDDTFIFRAGDGKNTILDYSSGELLQILDKRGAEGDIKNSMFSDDTLTLAIQGGGKIILSSVDVSTDFNINGEIYHVKENSLTK